jgi:predicted protein tyrosine phosphatase
MPSTLHTTAIDLTICGLDELCQHGGRGVSHVLSILDPGWPDPPDFARYDPHHRLTLRFHDVIAEHPGYVAPQAEHIEALIRYGEELERAGEGALRHLLIHCHAGVSRSTAAMAILLAQHAPGRERDAFQRVAAIRPQAWPNSRMVAFADELLGRRGRLMAALREHFERQARRRPELAEMIRSCGREAEMPF